MYYFLINNQNITIIQDVKEGLCVQQLLIKLKISIWEEHWIMNFLMVMR